MTRSKDKAKKLNFKEVFAEQEDFLRGLIEQVLQQVLESEMDEALGAEKGQRTPNRLGYRSGYYSRTLVTRVGKLELRVPQDRQGRFRTEVFERYQRSEKALVAALAEMYVQGVSTRKVKAITEELCGHEFSASAISRINESLDEELAKFAGRKLEEEYPYLVLDARYERIREDGVIRSQAVLVAIGMNVVSKGALEFLEKLRDRGLRGVQLVVSDDHSGLRKAIREVLPEALWQRCYVHFLRNALDYLPRKADDDCLTELRWIYERRTGQEARQDLAAWLARWAGRYPKLCRWVEENIEETLTFYVLPLAHHKHMKSTNLLERLNEELKRRTLVVRIFPNTASCLRLTRALAVEIHEDWIEATRYVNMDLLREQQKERRHLGTAA
jgi:putative transposase